MIGYFLLLAWSLLCICVGYSDYVKTKKPSEFSCSFVVWCIGSLIGGLIYFAATFDENYTETGTLTRLEEFVAESNNLELQIMVNEALEDNILRKSEYEKICDFYHNLDTHNKVKSLKETTTNKILEKVER